MSSVDSILSNAQCYASNLEAAAAVAVTNTLSLIGDIHTDVPLPQPLSPLNFKAPTFTQPNPTPINFTPPLQPEGMAPTFSAVTPPNIGSAPSNNVVPPSLSPVTKPSSLPDFTQPPPGISSERKLPDFPEYIRPDHPALGIYVTPEKPQYMLPEFNGHAPTELPTFDANVSTLVQRSYQEVAPSFMAAMDGYIDTALAKYNPRYAEQMQTIEDQLAKFMQGGTGLSPAVENAIYERARGKNNAEAARVRDNVLKDVAGRGFTLPSGAMTSALQLARQSAADNNVRAAGEIVINQAELEQKNLQFAVTTSVGLRTAVMNAMIQHAQFLSVINGQALDYAKTVLTGVIEAYNLGAKKVQLEIEIMRAEASVYESRMKGASLAIELYRSEVAALESFVNVDRAKVDMYKGRIEAATMEISAYKTHVDAIVSAASLDKLKIDLYQAQVQAYGMQVQAKESEWRGYIASIQGEESKVKMYQAQLEAFRADVDAYRTQIQAQAESVKAQAETNQALAMQAKAIADMYTAQMQGATMKMTADATQAKMELDVANATIKATADIASFEIQHETLRMQREADNVKLQQTAIAERLRSDIARMQTVAQVSSITANTLAGMAQAAMSGMNVLAAQTETI